MDYDSLDFHAHDTPPWDLPDGNNDCTCDICGYTDDPDITDFFQKGHRTICKSCVEDYITIYTVLEYAEQTDCADGLKEEIDGDSTLWIRRERLNFSGNDYDRAMYMREYERACREFVTYDLSSFAEWVLENKI